MTAPAKSKKSIVTEFRTGEILDAAREVFAKRGYRDATVDHIAEAAGVAKGTIYLYFQSKDEIYLATMSRCAELHIQEFETSVRAAGGATARERLRHLITSNILYADANRDFLLVWLAEMNRFLLEKPAPAGIRCVAERKIAMIREVLDYGLSRGEIRQMDNPAGMSEAIHVLLKNWAMKRLSDESPRPVEQDASLLMDLIWKGVSQ